MKRTAAVLIALLAGCASAEPEREAPAPSAAVEVPPADPAPAPAEERPLPSSIVLDASITRSGPGDGPPVTVSLRGGKRVEWTRTEVTREPTPFDPREVVARSPIAQRWDNAVDGEDTIRVECLLHGLPSDVVCLELDTAGSKVTWSNGSHGTLRKIHGQGAQDDAWSIEVLTSEPPIDPVIGLLRLEFDVHQPTGVTSSVATLGVDDTAAIDLHSVDSKWTLSSDRCVTQFATGKRRESSHPILRSGVQSNDFVRLEDANGRRLKTRMGNYAGSMSILEWGTEVEEELEPPVRVTVEWPETTAKRRVVVHMRNVKPYR